MFLNALLTSAPAIGDADLYALSSSQCGSVSGFSAIESRLMATTLITAYLQVILWCHQVGLLPDNIEGEEFGENEIAFPASVFDKMYSLRRNEIRKLSE